MAYTFKQKLVPSSKYSIKCPFSMTPQYITVHNTANNASAEAEVAYMIKNNNQTSYHVAIDEKYVIQAIPFNRNAWHAGDKANGTGNRKSIAIEICRSTGDTNMFLQAEKNASKYIATLLKQYGWGVDRVKQHHDWSGKNCPHRTRELGWSRFINMVKAELNALNNPKPVATTSNYKVGSYEKYVKTTDSLNIRAKRNPTSVIEGALPKGAVVKVNYIMYQDGSTTKKGSMWGSVYTSYGDGFINMDYTTPTSAPAQKTTKTVNYRVKITASALNVRQGADVNSKAVGSVKKGQVFTIVEEKNGWGKLKSGLGWIKLSYTTKL